MNKNMKIYEKILRERYIRYACINIVLMNGSDDTCEAGHLQEISYILRTLFGYTDGEVRKLDILATKLIYDD